MEFNVIIEKMSGMQLNLDKISKLDNDNRKIIIDLFNDLIDSINGTKGGFLGSKYDPIRSQILYNTLTENDYLITRREINIEKILN